MYMTCDQLVSTCIGWPNEKCELDQSVNASQCKWVRPSEKQVERKSESWCQLASLFGQGVTKMQTLCNSSVADMKNATFSITK